MTTVTVLEKVGRSIGIFIGAQIDAAIRIGVEWTKS